MKGLIYFHCFTINHYIDVPDHISIWTVRVRSGPYTYTRTVRPYAYGRTVWVYAYGPERADHTCYWLLVIGSHGLNLNKHLSQSLFLFLQIVIITIRWIKWTNEQLKLNICLIVYLNPMLVLSPKLGDTCYHK